MRKAILRNWQALNLFQVLLDVVIVFVGVYAAVLISNERARTERNEDAARVIEVLQLGVNEYEDLFNGYVQYHEDYNAQILNSIENGDVPNYGYVYYPSPQYPIKMINYILTNQSFEVFTIDFYLPLTIFANAMERIMYVEEKLVETSEQYTELPAKFHPDYQRIYNEQMANARRFYDYLEIRKRTASELARRAHELDKAINGLDN